MVLGNASAIKVGTTSQSKIYIGTTQVWPAGGGGDTDYIYISISSTGVTSAQTSGVIGVTASTTAWTVSNSDTTNFSVSKSSSSQASWTASMNTGNQRSATFTFRAGTASTTFSITQAAAGPLPNIYLISLKGNGKTITIPSAGENTYGTIYNLPVGVTGLTFEIYCNGRQLDPNSEIIMVQGNWTSSVYYSSTDNYGVSKTGAYNYNFNGVPSSSTGYLHMIFADSDSGDMISFYLQR